MNKIFKAGSGIAAAAAITLTGAIAVSAWGPTRREFTMANPAGYVTFNSITDNSVEGNELYFVSSSPYTGNAANNKWTDSTMVENGKEYVVRMYVHNNAAANLKLVAQNVRAYIVLPTETATSIDVQGTIYSSNANPTRVWDHTTFKSANGEKFNLALVDGSARYYNTDQNDNVRTFSLDGLNDSNDLFTDKGVSLGYDSMNGEIPGCMEYSGYVTFRVKAQFAPKPGTTVTKEVQVDGAEAWSTAVTAKAGEKVNYRIHFKNSGEIAMKNVLLREVLTTGMTYVKGSTELYNTLNPNGVVMGDSIMTENGLNIYDYAPNGDAWVYFSAIVEDWVGERCSNSILPAVVQANGGYGTVDAEANVAVIGKECKEEPTKPVDPVDPVKPSDPGKDTPSTLPKTGPGAVVGGIVGAGSLVTAGTYYVLSRKKN